jgi:ribosome-associated protein
MLHCGCAQRRGVTACDQEDVVLSNHASAAPRPAAAGPETNPPAGVTSDALLQRILASLDDDKAEEIVSIDLRGKSAIADHMVICSGRSSRQVAAMSEKLVERLKADFGRSSRVEGKDAGDWVLIDAGDVIVHVFRPEVRDFYQLEKMWMPQGARPDPQVPQPPDA